MSKIYVIYETKYLFPKDKETKIKAATKDKVVAETYVEYNNKMHNMTELKIVEVNDLVGDESEEQYAD